MDGPTVHCGPQTPARRDELCFSNGFACQVESTKSVVSTVTGIHNGKKDHHVSIKVFENSISFLTHDKGQNMQGQATLLQASFSHFERYFATDINRKTYNNFLVGECKSIQIIELEYPKHKYTGRSFGTPILKIDGFAIPHEEITKLAISEGYKNKSELIRFLRSTNWNSKGKIIHWAIEE